MMEPAIDTVERTKEHYRKASSLLLVTGATFLLSMKSVFAKLAYAEGASIDVSLLLRFTICLPLVWGFIVLRGKSHLTKSITNRQLIFFALLAFFGYYLGSKFDYAAISLIGASLSRVLLLTYPVIVVTLMAIITKSMPSRDQIIAVILCQIGAALTAGISSADLFEASLYGAMFSLLSGVSYAVYVVAIARLGKNIDSQYLVAWVVTFATLYMVIDFSSTNAASELNLSPMAWVWIVSMSVFSTALPLTLYAEAIKQLGGNNSAIFSAMGPVFTVGVAYLVFGETMLPIQIFGAVLILTSVSWLSHRTN